MYQFDINFMLIQDFFFFPSEFGQITVWLVRLGTDIQRSYQVLHIKCKQSMKGWLKERSRLLEFVLYLLQTAICAQVRRNNGNKTREKLILLKKHTKINITSYLSTCTGIITCSLLNYRHTFISLQKFDIVLIHTCKILK